MELTPAEAQYVKLKEEYKDSVLLFRMGDFYEVFDDDAKLLSKILGLTLTSRSKGSKARPMAGVPYHALNTYLGRIVKAGFKVAIADQLEDAKLAKGVVKRGVTRVVTEGNLIDEKNITDSEHVYISCIYLEKKKYGVSYLDLSTGEFKLFEEENIYMVINKLKVLEVREIVTTEDVKESLREQIPTHIKVVDRYSFDRETNRKTLLDHFGTTSLKGFGVEEYILGICAAGTLLKYVSSLELKKSFHITKISLDDRSKYMSLDYSTIKNLELLYPLNQNESNDSTLISVIDKTLTPMGKRKIREYVLRPLIDIKEINLRLDHVDYLFKDQTILFSLRENLDNIYDIERIVSRLGLNTISPKDFLSLKLSLEKVKNICEIFKTSKLKIFSDLSSKNDSLTLILDLISSTIAEDAPYLLSDGNVFVKGYDKELDELRSLREGSKEWMNEFQKKEIEKSGISTLKVRFNNVFGYYIEISRGALSKTPTNYIRKQTLVNAERFITEELKVMEEKILSAESKILEIETRLYEEFKSSFTKYISLLQEVSENISHTDVFASFSFVSIEKKYIRPNILEDGKVTQIKGGRHPVVENILKSEFIPNDIDLNDDKFLNILTGPNMSGKSTYIRQVALITLLSQIGCFVPAKEATLSVVDKIFSRIGASDNISSGESTFMVEMNETANILNNATEKSLIILDEVGRGTSTYDGVAIAWSIVEYIHEKLKARTLFATHYIELTKLASKYKGISNFSVKVLEEGKEVIFMHKIVEGAAERSFGVHVAKLAGLPKEVTDNATNILKSFESSKENKVAGSIKKKTKSDITPQIELF
jgi:DNA mismatch repair protein MutS